MSSLAALRQQLAAIVAPVPQHAPGTGGGVSTGIAALDAALSDGGLPCGRLTEIVGPRGSGKTTLVREIVAQALADKRWVAYIDAARTLAPADWASLATTDRLWIVRPPPGTGDAGRETKGSSPPGDRSRALGPWCADVLLRSGAFGLVVLDGAESLPPGVAVRLTRLARESHAAFVVMRDEEDPDAHRERPSAPGSSRGTKHGLQRESAHTHRKGGVVGGAVRLRVQRQERQRERQQERQDTSDPRSANERPDARWTSLGWRLADVQGRASHRTNGGLQDGKSPAPLASPQNSPLIPRPSSPVPRPQFVLQVSVEKGGTHHVVEVACAIAVARRVCTDSQVPDRRGVATRNRRGDRVAPHGAGERNPTPPPDGGRGLAAPVDARTGIASGGGSGGTLAPKRRFATPAIGRDEFLLAPPSSPPGRNEWEGGERERPRPPVRRSRVIGTGAPRKSPRPDPVHGRPGGEDA